MKNEIFSRSDTRFSGCEVLQPGVFTKAHHLPIQITTSERIEQTVLEEGRVRHQDRCLRAPRKHGSLGADIYFHF